MIRPTTRLAPVAMGALFLFGVPLFLALDRMMFLPPPLRDRPWPFEIAIVLGAACVAITARWAHAQGRWAAIATGGAAACVLNIVVLSIVARSDRLPPAAPELALGTHVPTADLQDPTGARVEWDPAKGPTLLVVFRGVWCPYCRNELSRLAKQVPRFSSTGIRVYGISTDDSEALLRHQRSAGLPFPLLSDPEQRVTSLCGFSMHCLLLFDRNGALRWGGFTESWRRPPRYEDVLQAAYRLP